jgi:hypothetical protein
MVDAAADEMGYSAINRWSTREPGTGQFAPIRQTQPAEEPPMHRLLAATVATFAAMAALSAGSTAPEARGQTPCQKRLTNCQKACDVSCGLKVCTRRCDHNCEVNFMRCTDKLPPKAKPNNDAKPKKGIGGGPSGTWTGGAPSGTWTPSKKGIGGGTYTWTPSPGVKGPIKRR